MKEIAEANDQSILNRVSRPLTNFYRRHFTHPALRAQHIKLICNVAMFVGSSIVSVPIWVQTVDSFSCTGV
jgi:hypothetical protein